MLGGRKVRSNKGKKRGAYGSRKKAENVMVRVNGDGVRNVVHLGRHPNGRKVRSNKGKKRNPYGPRTGRTRSGKKFRQSGGNCTNPGKFSYKNYLMFLEQNNMNPPNYPTQDPTRTSNDIFQPPSRLAPYLRNNPDISKNFKDFVESGCSSAPKTITGERVDWLDQANSCFKKPDGEPPTITECEQHLVDFGCKWGKPLGQPGDICLGKFTRS